MLMNSKIFVICLLAMSFERVACSEEILRNMWIPLNRENVTLMRELNRIEEEIRVEKQFIKNVDAIHQEINSLNELLEEFTYEVVDLGELELFKATLEGKYASKRAELLAEDMKMEGLWQDEHFRTAFDHILQTNLLVPNPIIGDLRESDDFKAAVVIKNRSVEAAKKKAEAILDELEEMNQQADMIDNHFNQIDFYEASQEYLELFNYSVDLEKIIRVFTSRQGKKNELTNGIREMRTMLRVNLAVDGNGDWKMRTFGFDDGSRLTGADLENPILSPEILKYAQPRLFQELPRFVAPVEGQPTNLMLKTLGKYAQYTKTIYEYATKGTTGKPKTVIEEAIDDLKVA